MKEKLAEIEKSFSQELSSAKSESDLEPLENKYLGRKNGLLTLAMKDLKSLPKEELKTVGKLANEVKQFIVGQLAEVKASLSGNVGDEGLFDPTLPGTAQPTGHLHMISQAIREISSIFEHIGFQRARYHEVEWDHYGFETLNMPAGHPARDEWETFFIDKNIVNKKLGQRILTPHTSSGQVREMEKGNLPIRMMNISKTYRRQIDASHAPMFHQFEGLVIDENINITHLKGTVDYFVKKFFGEDRKIRLRPHHFQFTEPSFEVDISCGVCESKGCKLCKEGWLELAGAGMVHPNVLKSGGIDPKKYSGFAFGWGVERCYMMKSGLSIDDIRLLYKNDLRILQQF
jgi:phenylalanyl-tRNA synthetase alpha chain